MKVKLFGGISASHSGTEIHFETDKARALLAYLVLEARNPVGRRLLADMLWPENSAAAGNLRKTISRLRRAIGDRSAELPLLTVDRETIRISPGAGLEVDVLSFRSFLDACRTHRHRNASTCPKCAHDRASACELYAGPFLAGFSISDSHLYQEWASRWRSNLDLQVTEALEALLDYSVRRAERDAASDIIDRLLRIDPWNELAHIQLMRLMAHDGRRAAALQHFRELAERHRLELGMEPSAELQDTIDEVTEGAVVFFAPNLNVPGLPAPLDPFVGRSDELGRIRAWVESPDGRLATIVGAGGVGKTRLLIAAVEQVAWSFDRGARYVSLEAEGKSWPDGLLAMIHGGETLLAIDGVEREPGAVNAINRLLEERPHLVVLATSRKPTGIPGETVIRLSGMELPPPGPVREADRYDSVALFAQSAARSAPHFELEESHLPAAGEICRLVGGMPLAVNLAAAWVATLPPDEIAGELRNSLNLLTSDAIDGGAELTALFEQSLAMLSSEEREVFARLSVFRGGFDRDAARDVASVSLTTLGALTRKSFVQRLAGHRFDVHPLFREFGTNLLRRSGELDTVAATHCDYFLDNAATRNPLIQSSTSAKAFLWLVLEQQNLQVAQAWAAEHAPHKAEHLRSLMHSEIKGYGFQHMRPP